MEEISRSRQGGWFVKLRPGDFMRQLIIVILGIFLTLTATNYLTGLSRKNEYRHIMKMVHTELVENKTAIDEAVERMVFFRETMQYFYDNRGRIAELPSDSVDTYYPVLRLFDDYYYTDHALEVLKYSSSIHSTRDLSIVRDIMEAYDNLAICQRSIRRYYEDKEQFRVRLDDEINWRNIPIVELLEYQYASQAMWDYIAVQDPYQSIRDCREASEAVGRAINTLERKYRIRTGSDSRD